MGKAALSAWIEAPVRFAFGLRRLGLQRLAEELLEKVYASSPYDLPLGASDYYCNHLKPQARRMPERMLLFRARELSEPSTLREISQFLGLRVAEVPIPRNLARNKSDVESGFRF